MNVITEGGRKTDIASSLAIDKDDNLYVAGYFLDTLDLDPGPGQTLRTSNGLYDAFVQKFDTSGNLLWGHSFGGPREERIYAIETDLSGNLYVTGFFEDFFDFDPGPGALLLQSEGSRDIFISKFDSAGNFLWTQTLGFSGIDEGADLKVDSQENVYVTGKVQGIVDFDPGPGTFYRGDSGTFQSFILKLNIHGQFIWAAVLGGGTSSQAQEIALDPNGSVYSCGSFVGKVDFDPDTSIWQLNTGIHGSSYVQKLSSNGDLIWAKALEPNGGLFANTLQLDHQNGLYLAGKYNGLVDFDPDTSILGKASTPSTNDGYLLKLTQSGQFSWVKTFESSGEIEVKNLHVTPSRRIHISGSFYLPTEMDPNGSVHIISAPGGVGDFFVSSYSQGLCQPSSGIDQKSACRTFTWIDGRTYTSDDSTATFTLVNRNGCDSVVTLNLNIQEVDTQVTQIGDTLKALAQGLSYFQWLHCDSNFQVISGATGANFLPTKSGNYAVEINQNWCFDTSACQAYIKSNPATNIPELTSSDDLFSFFPNPGRKHILVYSQNPGVVLIHDLQNKQLAIYPIEKQPIQIDLGLLINGVYFLTFEDNQGNIQQKKLIKY